VSFTVPLPDGEGNCISGVNGDERYTAPAHSSTCRSYSVPVNVAFTSLRYFVAVNGAPVVGAPTNGEKKEPNSSRSYGRRQALVHAFAGWRTSRLTRQNTFCCRRREIPEKRRLSAHGHGR